MCASDYSFDESLYFVLDTHSIIFIVAINAVMNYKCPN